MADPDENATDEYASWAIGETEVIPAPASFDDIDLAGLERALDAENDAFDGPARDEGGRAVEDDPFPEDR